MKNRIIGKGFVIVIILLFIGVGVQPAFAEQSIDSDDSELVEITVEVGNIEHKVVLSSIQAEELENLIDNTKAQLEKAITIEETSTVFDETVVSLYEFGMLPDDMSVEDAQRLVKGTIRFPMKGKALNHLSGRNLGIFDDDENRFCLIVGQTGVTFFNSFIFTLVLLLNEHFNPFFIFDGIFLELYFLLKYMIEIMRPEIFPLVIGNSILLGYFECPMMIPCWSPSHGWIHTFGLNGVKSWDGDLLGNCGYTCPIDRGVSFYGIIGFTGIRIHLDEHSNYYYLGTARHVKIKYFNPVGCDSK